MTINVSCPNCDDEFEYELERQVADDGIWWDANLVKQHCDCEVTVSQTEILANDAMEVFLSQ